MPKIKIKVSKSLTHLKLMCFKYRQIFVVFDREVEDFARKVAGGRPMLAITASEEKKTIETVVQITRWLLSQGADRNALVIAVGGGVTTDLVGFAASIYKRGVRYANVPTTLLAMVDAAIGGKTGVNLDSYKNMLGVIRQPEFTYICTQPLSTLPEREFRSGAAELLKTFIIRDADWYADAVKKISAHAEPDQMASLIEAAAKIKVSIVKKDEDDKGLRRVLNLGHTYAHAIEWYQHSHADRSPLSHGEAVAIGIVRAARKSEELGVAKKGLAERLKADFERCGLPTEMPYDESELAPAIRKDKKSDGEKINFVLIERIGKVVVKKI